MEDTAAINVNANSYAVIAFLLYLVMIVLIGMWSARYSSKGLTEFFLGGRKMNKFVVALSAVVSGRSSWLLLGLTGMAYVRGVSAIWAAVGYVIAEYLMFLFAAPKLRKATEDQNDLTLSDYFSSRFNDKTNLLRISSAVIILVFMSAYISAQFVGGGKALSSSFGMEPNTGVFLTALIVLGYTLMGGFLAVSITDVVQAVFMIFSLVALPLIVIFDAGGISNIVAKLNLTDAALLDPLAISAGALIGFVGIGLGSPGNPHILVRYMSIDDPKKLKFSAYVGTFWNIIMAVSAVAIGLFGRIYFTGIESLPGGDPENLFPMVASEHLHPVLFGIIIASILAAIMSTADSMLLVCASAVIRDIYQKVIAPGKVIKERYLVLYSRVIITVIVLASLLFGYIASDLVFWLVLFAWGGLGAAFGPAIILALFWEKTSKAGVFAGFITGVLTVIIWNRVDFLKGFLYELVPGFIFAGLAVIIFSYLKPDAREE